MNQEASSAAATKRIKAVIVIILVVLAFGILNRYVDGKFISVANFNVLITGSAIPTFVAWGLCFIFAAGITDFSIGAVLILSATVGGALGNEMGYPGLILGGILVGMVLLFINFQVYNITKIPSWIAGLGMTMIYEAVAAYYAKLRLAQGLQVVQLDPQLRALGHVPAVYFLLAAGLAAAYFLYNRTTAGLNVRAVGSNGTIAKMMGIHPIKALIIGGLIAGIFFGIAGVIKESYAGRVIAMTGLSSISTIFLPLAAVLLSQVLQKYINIIIAIPIATLFISSIFNLLTLLGVPSGTWQETILGMIVITFGMIAQRKEKGVIK
ncbi:ABC transporter permease [Anoxybacterium hadale]|uniref:ABC transporter permease n=1 Tax=Anoxybacterium hadale TaxID=3408580 RepID=A0ACD1ACJ7_9FIRM|nr:ABC transporter permease [Clostridiales bacterium]